MFLLFLYFQEMYCSQPSHDGSDITSDDSEIHSVESEHSTCWLNYGDVALDDHKLIDDENTTTVDEDIPSDYYIETSNGIDVINDMSKSMLGTTKPLKYNDHKNDLILKGNTIYMQAHRAYVAYYTVPFYWELSYPYLFPYGRGGPDDNISEKRRRPLTDAQYDLHVLLEASQRFVNVMPWLCGRYRYRTSRSCNRVAYMGGRYGDLNDDRVPTVSEMNNVAEFSQAGQNRVVKSKAQLETESLLRQLTSFGQQLKTSAMYIRYERQKLLCLLQAKDMTTPTWFLTLSSADLYWPELWMAIKPSLSYEDAACLSMNDRKKFLNTNPTMACRMFRERIECILKFILIKGKHQPLGKVVDWWFRVEFQSRGSLHVHSLLWSLLRLSDGTQINGDVQAELFRRCLQKIKKNNGFSDLELDDNNSVDSSNYLPDDDVDDGVESLIANDLSAACDESEVVSYDGSILVTNKLPTDLQECKLEFGNMIDQYVSASYPIVERPCAIVEMELDTPPKKKSRKKMKQNNSFHENSTTSDVDVVVLNNDQLCQLESVEINMIDRDSMNHPSLRPCTFAVGSVDEQIDVCDLIGAVNCHDPKHTMSCFKYNKNDSCRVCRYHFPRDLCSVTNINHRFSARYNCSELFVQLKRNHAFINNYNPWLMSHHRGNMDCQFVCNASGAATYASMYISKPEAPDQKMIDNKTHARQIREAASGVPDSLQKKLYLTSMAVFSSREVCLQEICWYLLGYPFVFQSRSYIKVNLLPPRNHYKVLLSPSQRAKLDPDAPAFIETDGVDKLVKEYMNLDTTLEILKDMSLYDFLSEYGKTNSATVNATDLCCSVGCIRYRKRKISKIVKVTPYIKFDENCSKSCYAMLLAHRKHYTNVEELGDPSNAVYILSESVENGLMCSSYEVLLHKQRRQERILDDIRTKQSELDANKRAPKRVLQLSFDEDNERNAMRRGADDSSSAESRMHRPMLDPLVYASGVDRTTQSKLVNNSVFMEAANYVKKIKDCHDKSHRDEQIEFLPVAENQEQQHYKLTCSLTQSMNKALIKFSSSFASLNAKQKACFHIVVAHLNEETCCKTEQNKSGQLRMLLSGPAGTGKTFLIHCLFAYSQLKFPYDGTRFGPVLKLAPTGVAAHNIRGNTIDSVMQFWSFSSQKGDLSNNILKDLQTNLGKVKLIIFDEYSMIGVQKLGKINRIMNLARAGFISECNVESDELPFLGGVHFMLAGDNCQLPPVKDAAAFKDPSFDSTTYSHEFQYEDEALMEFLSSETLPTVDKHQVVLSFKEQERLRKKLGEHMAEEVKDLQLDSKTRALVSKNRIDVEKKQDQAVLEKKAFRQSVKQDGYKVYRSLNTFVELTQQNRQTQSGGDEDLFRESLSRQRVG
jgi:hypothetical protein